MKKIIIPTILFVLMFFTSCSKDTIKLPSDKEEEIIIEEENIITEPCIFNLSTIEEGETIIIDCLLDLKGKTVTLPKNVKLTFGKGDIINGVIEFESGGKIDSRLLNISLGIEGSVELLNNDFTFFTSRWNVKEGKVTKSIAFQNHENIQKAIDLVKFLTPQPSFDRSIFNINELDAYFESNSNGIGIPIMLIPSDFNLNMTEETVLRVFPVNDPKFTSRVIRLVGVRNVNVTGGSIIGDRKERMSDISGNVSFEIKGGQNIVVDGTKMSYGSLTGLTINSVGRFGNPINDGTDYFPSKNVVIKNCVFDSNRSNNLSITDGEDITIMDCKMYRAGIDIGQSKGAAPRIGIVIEPFLGQKVNHVKILRNTVKESAGNSILAAFGNDFLISGNKTEKGVGWNGASNVKIVDNPSIGGVLAGDDNEFNLSQSEGNVVKGNTIINAPTGILASNDDILIEKNSIINCKVGMQLRNLKDSKIIDNKIISDVEGSFGVNTQVLVENVLVEKNEVKLIDGRPFSIGGINEEGNEGLTIYNNLFNCGKEGRITFSEKIKILKNTFEENGFGITSCNTILVEGNTITNTNDNQHAFFINNSSSVKNVIVNDNIFINESNQVAYGIRLFTVGDASVLRNTISNVVIKNNIIKAAGTGIHSVNFNGILIEKNKIDVDENCCNNQLYFRGDNSIIVNNTNVLGEALSKIDIEGSNNRIN